MEDWEADMGGGAGERGRDLRDREGEAERRDEETDMLRLPWV